MSNRGPLGVLKKDMVKPVGSRCLGDHTVAGDSAFGQPRASIIQQGDGSTVIEVICTCGRSIRLKCDYAHADVAEGGDSATPDRQDERKEQVSST